MDKLSGLTTKLRANGLSAEQIREITEWVKAKVKSLQKKPAAADIKEEKEG